MPPTLPSLEGITSAAQPEDLFGPLDDPGTSLLEALEKGFRRLSRICHPDVNANSPLSNQAFHNLSELRERAKRAILAGTYGKAAAVTVTTKKHRYAVFEPLAGSGVADCYRCRIDDTDPGVFTVAQAPADNDLMLAEAKALRLLRTADPPEAKGYFSMLPLPCESFLYRQDSLERQATVFRAKDGFVSLARIIQARPQGLDPRDMAWIWRRLLDVLGYAHSRGIIHGGTVPPNVLVGLGDVHEVVLANWQNAVCAEIGSNAHISSIDTAYEGWYPPEVAAKQPPTPGTDILMSARCMIALLGGDPLTGILPAGTPRKLQGFLLSCLIAAPSQRPQDAWALRKEFTGLIESLWGKRSYRPLHLPA